jgi:hypothetical protein
MAPFTKKVIRIQPMTRFVWTFKVGGKKAPVQFRRNSAESGKVDSQSWEEMWVWIFDTPECLKLLKIKQI